VCITQLFKDRKIEELLQALDECPDVYLIIGGKGALEGMVQQWAAKNPRLRYVGFVRGTNIADYTCAGDVVYYGFDPENPNARFSAPNKLFEALAAGKPLVTGDFGEIAHVVRQSSCGFVLPEYSVAEIRGALELLGDVNRRRILAGNAGRLGREEMNWIKGEEILYREYSALLPGALRWTTGGNTRLTGEAQMSAAPSVGVETI
jgi:glycosyltransferase involved in cell wall biosynthesis